MFPFFQYSQVIGIIGSINSIGFFITALTKTHKLTDLLGAGSFVIATGWLTLTHPTLQGKELIGIVNMAVMIWGIRLAGYLFYRILHTHEDKRLQKFFPKPNESFLDTKQSNFPIGLSIFWFLQSMWAMILLIPVVYLNTVKYAHDDIVNNDSNFMKLAIPLFQTIPFLATNLPQIVDFGTFVCQFIGITGMISGISIESLADYQKYAYKEASKVILQQRKKIDSPTNPDESHEREREDEDHWCDIGLWKYSQFPNYFGELLFWWSVYITTLPTLISWYYNTHNQLEEVNVLFFVLNCLLPVLISILSPIFITFLLLRLSGIPLLIKKHNKLYGHRKDYQDYIHATPLLIPGIPLSQEEQDKYYHKIEKYLELKQAQREKETQKQQKEQLQN